MGGVAGTCEADAVMRESCGMRQRAATAVIAPERREFPGDTDRGLKQIQSEHYLQLMAELYELARRRMLAAAALVGQETELVRHVRAARTLDRPLLRKAYRRVAAWFRYSRHAGPQLPLPFDDVPHEERLLAAWAEFFRREAGELTARNETARAILAAAGCPDMVRSKAAESHLVDLLDARYGRFTLERRLALLGRPTPEDEISGWRFAEEPDWVALLHVPGADAE